ncbi:hypothetical protein QUF63_16965 [Anaerolineales bacterium HSG25]|nr:hypothetical protein [Anaerolineales bacterium HSG25]
MKKQEPKKQEPRTHWHRILGKLFELLFHTLEVTVKVDFNLMSKPPRSDIFLLRCNSPTWTMEQLARLPDGIRNSLASHILIEFKYTESLNAERIEKVHGYDIFYRVIQGLSGDEVATFILSSKTPRPALLKEYGYHATEWPGVYQSELPMVKRVTILVLNELNNEPHNAYVKCFASRRHAKEAAFEILEKMGFKQFPVVIMSFIAGLRQLILSKEGNKEMKNVEVTADDVMVWGKEWRVAVLAKTPIEERLMGLKPEERLMGLKPEERLMGLKPEERLIGLKPEERLIGLKPEEVLSRYKPEERLVGLESYLEKQQQQAAKKAVLRTVLRTIKVRFKLEKEALVGYEKRLQKLELATLEGLSETVIEVENLKAFDLELVKIEPHEEEQFNQ